MHAFVHQCVHVCLSLYVMYVQVSVGPEQAIRSLRAGVTGSSKAPSVGAGKQTLILSMSYEAACVWTLQVSSTVEACLNVNTLSSSLSTALCTSLVMGFVYL